MLLFLFAVIVLIISVIATIYLSGRYSDWSILSAVMTFVSAIAVIVSIIVFICQGTSAPAVKANVEAEREIIIYQIENQNDFFETSRIGVNELYYTQVKNFNAMVRIHQFHRNNLWTNWYEPSFWNEIELIDYEGS